MLSSDAIYALILTTFAGFSTFLGAAVVFIIKKKSEGLLSIALGFAGGVMICVSLCDLFPGAVAMIARSRSEQTAVLLSVLFVCVGAAFVILIDRLFPKKLSTEQQISGKKDLMRVGMVSMLIICLHNFPEGMSVFVTSYGDKSLGLSIAAAMALHNIPEGMAVSMPVFFATGKKGKAFFYAFISGVAEPIGALLALFVLHRFITDFLIGALFAVVAGIMISIALEELLPSSRQYCGGRLALISALCGVCVMLLSSALFA